MSSTGIGALLAVCAAIALNGSFLMQHAGAATLRPMDARRPLATFAALLRSPLWTLGAVAGIAGWALHVAAMSEAPLSLVQAFVAGGLALAAPMAALGLRRRLSRAGAPVRRADGGGARAAVGRAARGERLRRVQRRCAGGLARGAHVRRGRARRARRRRAPAARARRRGRAALRAPRISR